MTFDDIYQRTQSLCTSNFGYTELFLLYNEAKELHLLCKTLSSSDVVVEVGSWKGRSSIIIGTSFRGIFYCVDTWKGTLGDSPMRKEATENDILSIFKRNTSSFDVYPIILQMDSVTASKQFSGKNITLLFLDADHSYEAVKSDLLAWVPKIKKYLVCHDYRDPSGVKRACDEVLGVSPYKLVDSMAFFDLEGI